MKEILGVNMYSTKEVATMLGVSTATLDNYRKRGLIKGQTIGRGYYFTEAGIKEFLQSTK